VAQLKTLSIIAIVCATAQICGRQVCFAADKDDGVAAQLQALRSQNEALQSQLRKQQALIDSLNDKVSAIEKPASIDAAVTPGGSAAEFASTFGLNKVVISGEGAAGFLKTGSEGAFPKGDFRLDEAKLFLETPVYENIYFFTEINLAQREEPGINVMLGEAYLDFEGISRLWNNDHMLSLRLGRMDIPFGEEYMQRDAIDNPLISHSLSDFWGIDQGIELYGTIGPVTCVAAVQNGGINTTDHTSDKSVAGRVSADPNRWLHFSVSGMRTGDLSPNDGVSAMWVGDGFFVPFGGQAVTKYHADLVEGDVRLNLPHGYIHGFGGYIRYDDNAPAANDRRDISYYAVEAKYNIFDRLYGAVRFSQIFANHGFPVVGNANMNAYLFSPTVEDIWRLSLGLGYRLNKNVNIKAEYTFERAKGAGGASRDHEDLFGIEAAYKF
jgi:hypothetical protein